jgi:hypothetical protein
VASSRKATEEPDLSNPINNRDKSYLLVANSPAVIKRNMEVTVFPKTLLVLLIKNKQYTTMPTITKLAFLDKRTSVATTFAPAAKAESFFHFFSGL